MRDYSEPFRPTHMRIATYKRNGVTAGSPIFLAARETRPTSSACRSLKRTAGIIPGVAIRTRATTRSGRAEELERGGDPHPRPSRPSKSPPAFALAIPKICHRPLHRSGVGGIVSGALPPNGNPARGPIDTVRGSKPSSNTPRAPGLRRGPWSSQRLQCHAHQLTCTSGEVGQ